MADHSTDDAHAPAAEAHAASNDRSAPPDDHAGGHGDHDSEPLGPIDVQAWGAGALGVGIGLLIALAFVVATTLPG